MVHKIIMPKIVDYNIVQWHDEKSTDLVTTKLDWKIYDQPKHQQLTPIN